MEKLGFSTLWTALAGTVIAVMYMFTTFASAADVERIEVRLLKADIREMRRELKEFPNDRRLKEYLEEAIDELCTIKPDDRECR